MQQQGGPGEERNRAWPPGLQEPPCPQHQHREGRGFFSQPALRVQRAKSLKDGSQVYLCEEIKLSILWVKNCPDLNKHLGLGGILPSLSNGKTSLCVFSLRAGGENGAGPHPPPGLHHHRLPLGQHRSCAIAQGPLCVGLLSPASSQPASTGAGEQHQCQSAESLHAPAHDIRAAPCPSQEPSSVYS